MCFSQDGRLSRRSDWNTVCSGLGMSVFPPMIKIFFGQEPAWNGEKIKQKRTPNKYFAVGTNGPQWWYIHLSARKELNKAHSPCVELAFIKPIGLENQTSLIGKNRRLIYIRALESGCRWPLLSLKHLLHSTGPFDNEPLSLGPKNRNLCCLRLFFSFSSLCLFL